MVAELVVYHRWPEITKHADFDPTGRLLGIGDQTKEVRGIQVLLPFLAVGPWLRVRIVESSWDLPPRWSPCFDLFLAA